MCHNAPEHTVAGHKFQNFLKRGILGVRTLCVIRTQARSQPSDNGGRFPQILDLLSFYGSKIGVPSGCLGETLMFKIIMIDDVTL